MTALLMVVLASGCSTGVKELEPTLPAARPSSAASVEPGVPAPTHSPPRAPQCDFPSRKAVKHGAGLIVELNIMSGNPNPSWRLTNAQGLALRRILQTSRRGIDTDGPDNLGGYFVTADQQDIDDMRALRLPRQFWVQGNNKISRFLAKTVPCIARK